ncbi:Citron homology (CNH) domain profile [Nakaseomyces glabratus]
MTKDPNDSRENLADDPTDSSPTASITDEDNIDHQSSGHLEDDPQNNNTPPQTDYNDVISMLDPFMSNILVDDLPKDITITCMDADENHIYLGTSEGELLHYYEIEGGEYLLVSRMPFENNSTSSIKKIKLLPNIDRALILCGTRLAMFLLPEFAPCPNVKSINDVNDFDIHSYSRSTNTYRTLVASDKNIMVFKYGSNAISAGKILIDYKNVQYIKAHDNILLLVRDYEYELYNLEDRNSIPLFRVSETGNGSINPLMEDFNSKMFILSSGGNSKDDNAMGLVVDHVGEIVKATLVFDHYPQNVVIHYPYILALFHDGQLLIYRLKIDEEPELVQRITNNDGNTLLTRVRMRFKVSYQNNKMVAELVEKIRKVPLSHDDNSFGVDREKALAENMIEPTSSIIMWYNAKIYCLFTKPFLCSINKYGNDEVKRIQEYIEHRKNSDLKISKLQKVEMKYLSNLVLLWDLFDTNIINKHTIQKWVDNSDRVDVRQLLFLLDYEIFGEIWIFNGLNRMMKHLKTLPLKNKCNKSSQLDDLQYFQKILKDKYCTRDKLPREYKSTMKSLTIAIFRILLAEGKHINLDEFEDAYLPELIHIIQKESEPNDHNEMLIRIYTKMKDHVSVLHVLKSERNFSELMSYLDKNVEKLSKEFLETELIDIIYFVLSETKDVNSKLISDIFKILNRASIDSSLFLGKIQNNTHLKVKVLEVIGTKNTKDENFLLDYYIANMKEEFEDNNLSTFLLEQSDNYKNTYNYFKKPLHEFLTTRVDNESTFQKFRVWKTQCSRLTTRNTLLEKEYFDQVKTFNDTNTNILLFYLFFDIPDMLSKYWLNNELHELIIDYNDFLQIEEYTNEKNFIDILNKYLMINDRHDKMLIVTTFLKRNQKVYLHNRDLKNKVLDVLPSELPLNIIHEVLHSILTKGEMCITEFEIKKSLLKADTKLYSKVLNTILDK